MNTQTQKDVAFLFFVDAINNHNKYYRMSNNGDDTFTAEYGRVGARGQLKQYPMSRWDTVYDQKIRKGYVDQTDIHEVKVVADGGYKPIADDMVRRVIDELQRYANSVIKSNYSVSANEVSPAMVEEARDILFALNRTKHRCSLTLFNDELLKLFSVIPRAMRNVSDCLAQSPDDYDEIICREQKVLDVMAQQVGQYSSLSKRMKQADSSEYGDPDHTILEAYGLDIRPCTDEENENIKRFLTPESADLFDCAFRVHNKETDEAFEKYCKREHIGKRNIHFLYHGSRNQNWWGITTNGLVLNPKAIINGKMFGNGCYFAPRAKKSIHYTDLRGEIYTKGNSDTGYLAVFKVAYKKPFDVYSWDSSYSYMNWNTMKSKGTDATFAHKGSMLVNDEVIIYREEQCTLQYLIKLKK